MNTQFTKKGISVADLPANVQPKLVFSFLGEVCKFYILQISKVSFYMHVVL